MRVQIAVTAQHEIDGAAAQYHTIHPSLATRLLDEVSAIVERISSYPEIYRRTQANHRIAPLHGFPFELYYRITNTEIQVTAFFPGRIDPSRKLSNLTTRK